MVIPDFNFILFQMVMLYYHQNSFILCVLNWMMFKSISLVSSWHIFKMLNFFQKQWGWTRVFLSTFNCWSWSEEVLSYKCHNWIFIKKSKVYHNQKLEQPSIIVTVSTGKTFFHINDLRLHSAFHLQVNESNKINVKFCLPCKEVLQTLWNKYLYLQIIVHDEISVTVEHTFNCYLNLNL